MENKNIDVVKGLKPEKLWRIFSEMACTPRPSKKEGKIREYLVDFAKSRNIECKTDKIGNVLMYKPSQNSNSDKTIILQAHMDMVCEKDPDVNIDFENDPITLVKDGENITAKGTTLGADDGIGVATALAILEDKDMPHPPLQVLITVDEETGMTGAFELDESLLKADYLINLDTEVEGEIYIGCAGGENVEVEYNLQKESIKDSSIFKFKVDGLRGGHSGVDIHENFGNAIKIGTYLITQIIMQGIEFNIINIDSGTAQNAIPRAFDLCFAVNKSDKEKVISIINKEKEKIVESYKNSTEPNIIITLTEDNSNITDGITKEISKNIIMGLNNVHSGIYRMSTVVAGLVETSNNLSTVKQTDKQVKVVASARSSNMVELDIAINMIRTQFLFSGADRVEATDRYPGWDPISEDKNPLLKKYIEVHKKVRGKDPIVKAIHAGLECGVLSEKMPSTLMISVGPSIHNPHSPSEYVEIDSVNKYWEVLIEFLKTM